MEPPKIISIDQSIYNEIGMIYKRISELRYTLEENNSDQRLIMSLQKVQNQMDNALIEMHIVLNPWIDPAS